MDGAFCLPLSRPSSAMADTSVDWNRDSIPVKDLDWKGILEAVLL